MTHAIRTSAALLLAAFALPLVALPAEAGTVDHRPCATLPEYERLPEDQGKAAVETFIDTRGWVAARDLETMVKHYAFCGHPQGWLAVAYTHTKLGWRYRDAVLIFWCKVSTAGGPRVPCDRSVPCPLEEYMLGLRATRPASGGGQPNGKMVT